MPSPLPGTSVPSPAPSNVSSSGLNKRKRDGASTSSNHLATPRKTAVELTQEHAYQAQGLLGQMQVAIAHLKETGQSKTFEELVRYMSIHRGDPARIAMLERAMKTGRHPKIEYNPKNDTFKYRSILPVHDEESLKKYLQTRRNMIGVKIDDIKDGWEKCTDALESMAGRGEILLVRQGSNKPRIPNAVDFSSAAGQPISAAKSAREHQPKTVWASDPSLVHIIPEDLKQAWLHIGLPTMDSTMREKLVNAGLKPTTAPISDAPVVNTKKPRKARKNAKGTATNANVPMRDYSHLRK
jgi:transcription initiation factor TFIIE subunit beta